MAEDPAGFSVDVVLCDSAQTASGKLFIQGGGWHTLPAMSFPFHHARIGLGVVLGIPYTATNQTHPLKVRLEGEDGELIFLGSPIRLAQLSDGEASPHIEVPIHVGRPARLQPGEAQIIALAFNFDQLRFETPGTYSFVLSIDDMEMKRVVFRVLSIIGMLPVAG